MPSIYLSASTQERNAGVDGITEEERMQALARGVAAILRQAGITVYLNNPAWSLSQIVADSNMKQPDLHLALHSNAGGGSGTETWTYKTQGTKSAEFGKRLQAALVAALGLPDRGVKDATVPGYRWAEVVQTRATAVLTEIFFHDNARDVARFKERRQAVVEAIARTVCEWFGVAYPKQKEAKKGMFNDVPATYWAAKSIERLAQLPVPIFRGDTQGNFRPDQPVTRAELAVVLDQLLKFLGK